MPGRSDLGNEGQISNEEGRVAETLQKADQGEERA